MSLKYKELLSPLKIGNIVLRNRLAATASNAHFVQGSETWPTDAIISHYAQKAKAGAAYVCCKANNPSLNEDTPQGVHNQRLNLYDPYNHHYFVQLTDTVHYYGAKAQLLVLPPMKLVKGYDASDGIPGEFVPGDDSAPLVGKEAPRELLYQVAEAYAQEAALGKSLGFDMCYIHMAYRLMFPGRFLSPLCNKRTDEFGGSLENRARFPLLICESIKKACGKDFLIEVSVSGEEVSTHEGGLTVEDLVQFAKMAEGKIDILQIRDGDIDPSQPIYLDLRKTPTRDTAAAIKAGIKREGIKMAVTFVGGCHDPETGESFIEDGVCDIVGSARAWISNAEYGNLIYEGRGDDIAPCLRCNKCHWPKPGYWNTICSVNPIFGFEHKIDRLITTPDCKKKVAVVGGGISGMQAAIICSKRGHSVSLFEKSDRLGGVTNVMEGIDFKWTVLNFRDYMIHQLDKAAVDVYLGTEADPEMLKKEGFDTVIIAVGAQPIVPPIPGADGKNVIQAVDTVLKESSIGEKVVVIGGGEVGVEMALYLARKGHDVCVIEMRNRLAEDSAPVHFRSMLQNAWEAEPTFHEITKAVCTGISESGVTYKDEAGTEHTLSADTVILATGMMPYHDEYLKLSTGDYRVYRIGDCEAVGSIQTAMRTGFAIANNI